MTRMSKQGERRNVSPRRPTLKGVKTGAKKEAKPYKEHTNSISTELKGCVFIPKIKSV